MQQLTPLFCGARHFSAAVCFVCSDIVDRFCTGGVDFFGNSDWTTQSLSWAPATDAFGMIAHPVAIASADRPRRTFSRRGAAKRVILRNCGVIFIPGLFFK